MATDDNNLSFYFRSISLVSVEAGRLGHSVRVFCLFVCVFCFFIFWLLFAFHFQFHFPIYIITVLTICISKVRKSFHRIKASKSYSFLLVLNRTSITHYLCKAYSPTRVSNFAECFTYFKHQVS